MRASVIAGACACVFVIACAEIVGIGNLPTPADAGDASPTDSPTDAPKPDSGPSLCVNATEVISASVGLDSLATSSNGFVYGHIIFSSGNGVVRCMESADCNGVTNILTVAAGQTVESFAVGSLLEWTTLASTNQGAVNAANLDGTGAHPLVSNLGFPSWLATSLTRTFWVDDPIAQGISGPASVHCNGCGGTDLPWITGLGQTYALFADANDVYVVGDDGTGSSTASVFGCSVLTACANSPRTVTGGLDENIVTGAVLASDGTNVYLARSDSSDLVRIDAGGTVFTLATSINVVALAVDSVANEMFYATDMGDIVKSNSDGTNAADLATCPNSTITTLAIDPTRVYVNVAPTLDSSRVYAIAR